MKVAKELNFNDLFNECWCCEDVLKTIADNNAGDALMDLLDEAFSEEIPTMTAVNDLIRFDYDWIYECLGIDPNEDEEDEDDVGEE